MNLPVGSEDWVSKSEKKIDGFEEIGKVDDSNIDENFGESMKTMTTSCFRLLRYNPAVFPGSSC